MSEKIIIAGFGGQGIILSGLILAHCAMIEGKKVSHFPSYGVEMRGGTCNCSVIISDEMIPSPIVADPNILLVLNQPSKDKFEPRCRKNSIMFLNKSLITDKVSREDITGYYIDATNIANRLGNVKATNMVMLGALIKQTNIVKIDTMINELPNLITARNKSLIELNNKALFEGYNSL